MAIFKIIKNKYDTIAALNNVFRYVCDKSKSCSLIGAQNILIDSDIEELTAVNRYFRDNTQKKVIHFIIGFAFDEYISPEDAYIIGYDICALLPEYQIKFAVHQDTYNLHMHFAMNPISLYNGHKFCFTNENIYHFMNGLRNIFNPYEIKIKYVYSEASDEFIF